jgi:glycosyltransferase involved in cell wall biosynthesis
MLGTPHLNQPSRIAVLVRTLYGSGAQRAMLLLAAEFAAQGHRVDFLSCRRDGHFAEQVPDGVDFHAGVGGARWSPLLRAASAELAGHPPLLNALVRFREATFLPWIAEYLRRAEPDAIVTAGVHCNLLAILGRRLAGIDTRVVVSEHNHLSAKIAPLHKRWKLHLVRTFYGEADAIVGVSDGVADDLAATAAIPRARIERVYNPVVSEGLLADSRRDPDHRWLREPCPPVILSVGKLIGRKDYPTLLHAFRKVRSSREARLIILGEGPEERRLKKLAQSLGVADSVDFPGFVANPFAYMSRAAVLTLSSRWEGAPMVILEALACGCPVVSVDCPSGPAELLEDGKYGALVPVGDADAMALAIASTLDRAPPAALLRARSREFHASSAGESYLDLCLPGRPGRCSDVA